MTDTPHLPTTIPGSPPNLRTLSLGDRLQTDLLVVERSERTKSNGDPFVVLTLGNSTGTIESSPIWLERLPWVEGAERGAIVQAIGDISIYGRSGKRQLTLTAPLRVLPKDGYDIRDFLPTVGDCTRLWDWIDRQRAEMKSSALRDVVDLFFGDDTFRAQFELMPGSPSGGHHCKLGGLLMHVYEVTAVAKLTARTMRANADLAVTGALLHDIGKVEAYEIGVSGFGTTPRGTLLGHVVLGTYMLHDALYKARQDTGREIVTPSQLLEIEHMILSHHGSLEFGSPVQPMTLEAEILHWADEASAKGNDMLESLEDDEAFLTGGEISDRRPWRVGRKIWRRPHTWE